MRYKVTKQFSSDIEVPLAEFVQLNDAELFITAKSSADESQKLNLIYRLYERGDLLHEFNKNKITTIINRAQYAEGDIDLPRHFAEPFSVIFKTDAHDQSLIAKFCQQDDAELLVESKSSSNSAPLKANEAYLIMNGSELVKQTDLDTHAAKETQGSQGKGNKSTFRPSPFETSLRLGPKKWVFDEDEDKDKDNPDK